MADIYEVRCPIHGFIKLNAWEHEIIDSTVFQRLRRIRQLGLTEMVYPSATHSRFEHSLGVMHVATLMYDRIVDMSEEFLIRQLGFNKDGLGRDRTLVRLACLLHDVGHPPFSHAGEESNLMPTNPNTGKRFTHVDYSAAVIRMLLKDIIESHPTNQNYRITAEEIAGLLEGDPKVGRSFVWHNLISGQLDADRVDYLLRDSHHIGVQYGTYDLPRLLVCLAIVNEPATDNPTLAIEDGGLHVAESLILARYMMFTQVYFHRTRRAYDHHIGDAVKDVLSEEKANQKTFPPPVPKIQLEKYLEWDDWKVLGLLKKGQGGQARKIILERTHDRCIHETEEVPTEEELNRVEEISQRLGGKLSFVDSAEKSWYSFGQEDIRIVKRFRQSDQKVFPLSHLSSLVAGLKPVKQKRIYAPFHLKDAAEREVAGFKERGGTSGSSQS